MSLSPSQLATLKSDILADPALSAKPNTPDGNTEIAVAYAQLATPDYWVWRSSLSKTEVVQQTSVDGTTFIWVGNGFITRSVGEQQAWNQLFDNEAGVCNPSLANVRQAFVDIFSGAGNAASNRTHLSAIARRRANRGEKLFATGAGSTASPSTMSFEGSLTADDVQAARNLP